MLEIFPYIFAWSVLVLYHNSMLDKYFILFEGSPDKTNTPSTVLNNINNNSNAVSETSDAGFFPTSITTKSATIFDSVDDKSDTLSEVPSISSPTSLSNSFSSKSSFSKDKTTQPSNDKAAGEKILSRRPSQSKSFLQIQSSLG